jgi:hypothetical protein
MLDMDEIWQYLQLWRRIEDATLSTDADKLLWIWSMSGKYTAKFAYLPSFQGSNVLQGMEADLEEMGTAASQVLPLPCQY